MNRSSGVCFPSGRTGRATVVEAADSEAGRPFRVERVPAISCLRLVAEMKACNDFDCRTHTRFGAVSDLCRVFVMSGSM